MFRGVQNISMDAKGRFAVPQRQRARLLEDYDGQLVMTINTASPCLVIYPMPHWEKLEAHVEALPSLDPQIKRFQRKLLGYAVDLELDTNGRVLVPPALREYARLEKELVLVGQGNKLELWAQPLWQAEMEAELDGETPSELRSVPGL